MATKPPPTLKFAYKIKEETLQHKKLTKKRSSIRLKSHSFLRKISSTIVWYIFHCFPTFCSFLSSRCHQGSIQGLAKLSGCVSGKGANEGDGRCTRVTTSTTDAAEMFMVSISFFGLKRKLFVYRYLCVGVKTLAPSPVLWKYFFSPICSFCLLAVWNRVLAPFLGSLL